MAGESTWSRGEGPEEINRIRAARLFGVDPRKVQGKYRPGGAAAVSEGMLESNASSGGTAILTGAVAQGACGRVFTTANAGDIGCVYGARRGRPADAVKLYFAGRVAFIGTVAAGAWTSFGFIDDGGASNDPLVRDSLVFGQIHAGSATNFVVCKGDNGTETYIDTGVALHTNFVDVWFCYDGSQIIGQVGSVQVSGSATGLGTSANAWTESRNAGNGAVVAARQLYTDWDYYATVESP